MSLSESLYSNAPVPLQNLLLTVYGALRRRKRYGGEEYRRIRRELTAAQQWTDDQIREEQGRRLAHVIRDAAVAVPYCRDLFRQLGIDPISIRTNEDLQRLPILTKEAVRSAGRRMWREGIRPFWRVETSGSTGTPITIALDEHAYKLSMALLADFEQQLGIAERDRRATFAGRLVQPVNRDKPPFWRFNWADRQMLASSYHMSDKNLLSYLVALRAFRPQELIGYPSSLYTLADYCARTGTNPGFALKAIVTNSETLLDWQRDTIRAAFQAPVFDYYGSAESVVFAGQCSHGFYHPNPLIGIAEVVDENGNAVSNGRPGRLICTTLANSAMPLLRYEIGDIVTAATNSCDCGRRGPAWATIVGRTDDVVVTPRGRPIGRLDHVFKGVSGVREAQIVQTSATSLVLRIVPATAFEPSMSALLVKNTIERVGSEMNVTVSLVSEIERTHRGKFKSVIRVHDPSRPVASR